MDALERTYNTAVGCCLNAAMDLRRLDGKAALEELQFAIRIIERAQSEARREELRRRTRIEAFEPLPCPKS